MKMNSVSVALPLPIYKVFSYRVPQEMSDKIQIGTIVEVEFHGSYRFGCVWSFDSVQNDKEYELKSILSCLPLEPLADWQLEWAKRIANQTFSSLGEALELFIPKYHRSWEKWTSRRIFLANEDDEYFLDLKKYGVDHFSQGMNLFIFKDLLGITSKKIDQLIKKNRITIVDEDFKKNQYRLPHQKWVKKWWQRGTINESLNLLGKLIEDSFSRGLKVFILFPGPKILDYFLENLETLYPLVRFLSFDGRLTARRRMLTYQMIREGYYDVLLGTRLAQFLPIHQIGVQVLFDPDDFGHYSDQRPHYHSFHSLIEKVNITGGDLHIIGTIPDLTLYFGLQEGYFESQTGQIKRFTKEQKLELVTYEQRKTILPQLIQKAIAQNITSQQNSIIWVQKTGYSVALGCSDCGFYYSCPDCDVALRFYQKERILRCPRCGKKVIPESFCPECHGPWMKTWGDGIEKVYQFLKRIFSGVHIVKIASDQERSELNMKEEEPMIIVGTSAALHEELLAHSTLFIIHSFEDWLFLPEFQVREKFYQNIQRALYFLGASKPTKTRVIIETSNQYQKYIDPFFHPPAEFYKQELEKRKKYRYPPSQGLLQVIARSRNKLNREMVLNRVKNELDEKQFTIDGPFPGDSYLKKSGWSDQLVIKFEPAVLSILYDKVSAVVQARKSTGVEVDFKVYNTLPDLTKDDL
ncbi:MAG TPA: hypothetical protein DCY12_02205 [Candidatus Atribacteria bacterium]|nr:hypothetical protein [Candidatus Atribacteria bacterium]